MLKRSGALVLVTLIVCGVMSAQADEAVSPPPPARAVAGKLVAPADAPQPLDLAKASVSLHPARRLHLEVPPNWGAMSQEEKSRWFHESDEGKAYIQQVGELQREVERLTVTAAADGRFEIKNVAPGAYGLTASIHGENHSDLLASASQQVEVPAGPSAIPVEVGDVPLTAHRVVRVGDEAPAFEVKTIDGQPLKLADYRGRYVLLDFWATWCGPCVGETPNLKATYEAFKGDDRFAMIALSLDDTPDKPRAYAKDKDLHWVQGFLGDWNADTVTKAYGVNGIPEIMLIGPDGKVIAKDLRGAGIKDAVGRALTDAPVAQ